MKINKYILFGSFILIGLAVLGSLYLKAEQKTAILQGANVPKGIKDRVFKKKLKEISRFDYLEGQATCLMVDRGRIYIADQSCPADSSMYTAIDYNGHIAQKFAHKGGALNEVINGYNFDVDQDTIFILDKGKRLFKKSLISENLDSTIAYHKYAQNFFKMGKVDRQKFMMVDVSKDTYQFSLFDFASGSIQKSTPYAEVFAYPEKEGRSLAYEGFFTNDPAGGSYYFCYHHSQFLKFDTDGNLVFVKHTIDGFQAPEVDLIKQGDFIFHTLTPNFNVNQSATVNEDGLLNLSNIVAMVAEDSPDNCRVIDCYNTTNGHYQYSMKISHLDDQMAVEIRAIENNQLIVLYDNQTIVKYAITEG